MDARLFHHPLTKPSYLLPSFLQILHWTNSNHPLLEFTSQTDCLTSDFRVSVKEVSRLIHNLESSKATGPDEVPVVVLKNISPEIAPILSRLLTVVLRRSVFLPHRKPLLSAQSLRILVIAPLHLNTDQIACRVNTNKLLSDVQYGFRISRSTADVLTVISHVIIKALDSTFDARAIALDISKAFYQVWHKGLLCKLSSYGISGRVQSIIKSFLTHHIHLYFLFANHS